MPPKPSDSEADEGQDAEDHRSQRQKIRDRLEDPGADDKERGKVCNNEDGSLQWYDSRQMSWKAAVYHKDIRIQLLDIASQHGTRTYDFPRRQGKAPDDRTAFHAPHQHWSPERDLWPRITDNILNRLERRGYRGRNAEKVPKTLSYRGLVVLDHDNHPVRCFEDLPIVLSSAIDGWELEVFFRLDARVQRRDIRARLPSQFDTTRRHNNDLFGMSALGNRRMRFRKDAGILAWETRKPSAAIIEFLKARLPAGAIEANTTRDVGPLTDREKFQLQAIEDRLYPAKTRKNASKRQQQASTRQPLGSQSDKPPSPSSSDASLLPKFPESDPNPHHSQDGAQHSVSYSQGDDVSDDDSQSDTTTVAGPVSHEVEVGPPTFSSYGHTPPHQHKETTLGHTSSFLGSDVDEYTLAYEVTTSGQTDEDSVKSSYDIATDPRAVDIEVSARKMEVPDTQYLPRDQKRSSSPIERASVKVIGMASKRQRRANGSSMADSEEFAMLNSMATSSRRPDNVLGAIAKLEELTQSSEITMIRPACLYQNPPSPATPSCSPLSVLLSAKQGNSEALIDDNTIPGLKLAKHLAVDFRQRTPQTPQESLEVQRVLEFTRQDFQAWLRGGSKDSSPPATDPDRSYVDQLRLLATEFESRWVAINPGLVLPSLRVMTRWRRSFFDWKVEDLTKR